MSTNLTPALTPGPASAAQTVRDAAVAWLLGRINYERTAGVPYGERQLKLDRMRGLVTAMGSPDAAAPIVHVAGTKGKGSTAAMIAAVLTAAGYRTGVFSSPHLEQLEERFAIDGQPCSGEQLAALVDCVRPVVAEFDRRAAETDEDGPTFFDITTAIALVHFAQQQCGAVVLEVGLGGRLDSTNVCLPAVSVITSISLDHMKQLGNTLAAIAREKAGIIKPGVPVVSGVTQPEPREVIAEIARDHGCRLIERGVEFDCTYHGEQTFEFVVNETVRWPGIKLGLAGPHQAANAAVALAAVEELASQGWRIDESARRQGLATVKLPGRCEVLPGEPAVVLDTAHNAASAAALVATLGEQFPPPRTLVVACSKDKDVRAIAAELAGAFDQIVVTAYQENPRATPVEELTAVFEQVAAATKPLSDVMIHKADTPVAAWRLAKEVTPPGGVVCITGSFFLAAELRRIVTRHSVS